MRTQLRLHLLALTIGLALPITAYALEAGIREVPAKELAVPTAEVSPQMQALIGAPLQGVWNEHPNDAAAWKALMATGNDLRRLALALEGTTEAPHFDRAAFMDALAAYSQRKRRFGKLEDTMSAPLANEATRPALTDAAAYAR